MSSINSVSLIGRLTQDPAVTPSTDTTRCKMRIAVQRGRGKDGEDKGANYFDVVAFEARPSTAASTCARAARSPLPATSTTASGPPRTAARASASRSSPTT
jgi:single-stranded DNA-binding protein